MENIEELNKKFGPSSIDEVLNYFSEKYEGKIALASSLSIEDQVVTHLLASVNPKVKIFTLDTGRLPEETYKLIELTNNQYDIKIDIYFPDKEAVETMVNERGVNLFYNSIEDRKRCCNVRKIIPLKRALQSLDVWITGLRREQSVTRETVNLVEYDKNFGVIKLNPLYNWSETQVWEFIKKNNIPYNALYRKKYTSIGCAPCTRAVKEGEGIRDGRWWWENPETKECGLHLK